MSSPRKDLSKWVIDESDSLPLNTQKSSNDLSNWQVEGSDQPANTNNSLEQKLMSMADNNILLRPMTRLSQDTLSLVKNLAGTIAGGIPATINELASSPWHATRQLAAGIGTIPTTMGNTLLNIPEWVAHLYSNKASNAIKKYTPQFPTEMYQNLIGGENPNEEDIQVRNLAQLTPIGIPLGKGAISTAGKMGRGIIGKSDPLQEAKALQTEIAIGSKEKELEQSKLEHEQQTEAYNRAVEEAKEKVNMVDASRMKYHLNNQENKINEMKNQSDMVQQQLQNITIPELNMPEQPSFPNMPQLPEKPQFGQEHTSRLDNALNEAENQKQNLMNAEEHHVNAQKLADESESNLSDYLEPGAAHDVRVAQVVKNGINNLFKEGSNKFENLKSNLEDKNIVISNTDRIKQINDALLKLTQEKGGLEKNAKEIQNLGKELQSLNGRDIIPANDYVQAYQSVNGYMRKAYENAYKPGLIKDEQVEWKKRGDEAKARLKEMSTVLKENIGENDFNDLLDAKNYWKNNIVPLYKNPLYHKIMNEERMSSTDMISSMRGNISGMDIIKNIIKNDPQALKHLIGQRYEKVNSTKIYKPNELTNEYLVHAPDLQKMIEHRNSSLQMAKDAKKYVEKAKENHANAQNEVVEASKNAKEKEKEISLANKEYVKTTGKIMQQHEVEKAKIMKQHEANVARETKKHELEMKSHIKNREDFEEKIKNYNSQIKDLEDKNSLIEKHMNEVKKEAQKKNITLKQKIQHEKDLKELKKQLVNNRQKITESTTGLRKLWLIGKTIYRVGKRLT